MIEWRRRQHRQHGHQAVSRTVVAAAAAAAEAATVGGTKTQLRCGFAERARWLGGGWHARRLRLLLGLALVHFCVSVINVVGARTHTNIHTFDNKRHKQFCAYSAHTRILQLRVVKKTIFIHKHTHIHSQTLAFGADRRIYVKMSVF